MSLFLLALITLLLSLILGCVRATIPDSFTRFDARVRGDFGIPDNVPAPRLIMVDDKAMSGLNPELRAAVLASGGAVYDPNTQTIYLDQSRYRDGSIYHELAHHYIPYMTESQRFECLARLYELLATNSSFSGCAP